jgi:glycosyltransferase involved in cell wall biosynthesis
MCILVLQVAQNYLKQDQLFHLVMHLPCVLASVSSAVQDILQQEFGRSSLLIPNGIDCERFRPGPWQPAAAIKAAAAAAEVAAAGLGCGSELGDPAAAAAAAEGAGEMAGSGEAAAAAVALMVDAAAAAAVGAPAGEIESIGYGQQQQQQQTKLEQQVGAAAEGSAAAAAAAGQAELSALLEPQQQQQGSIFPAACDPSSDAAIASQAQNHSMEGVINSSSNGQTEAHQLAGAAAADPAAAAAATVMDASIPDLDVDAAPAAAAAAAAVDLDLDIAADPCNTLNTNSSSSSIKKKRILIVGNPALPLKGFPTAIAALAAVSAMLPISVRWVCQVLPTAATVPNLPLVDFELETVVSPSQAELPALYKGNDVFMFSSR